ncbi:hypothetical protein Q1695_004252 [Nippostrongylus brasiliensis]|nr:hypothetical protein Q1695_004252 [Nippostrongylus brasiliensis]
MDVENVKIVDGLIFGYLTRRQYCETLRIFCDEAPSLRDENNRFQSGGNVFIKVNDQLHDKTLEQIVNAFNVVGRFDVSPELVDFGIRLRDLTNEFSTMTAVRGRSVSDNQMKLYGKRVFSKRAPPGSSFHSESSQQVQQNVGSNCSSQNGGQDGYSITDVGLGRQQMPTQQEYGYEYQAQPHASSYQLPASCVFATEPTAATHGSGPSAARVMPSVNTSAYQVGQNLPAAQAPASNEEPMLTDYSDSIREHKADMATAQCHRAADESEAATQSRLNTSFSSESGAHKRKAAVPHRRDELVAHTAQSLIVPNGVLLDLDAGRLGSSTSQVSLLSNIDDTAMQCLDRLINGNLDEVFPFCGDHDDLSGFATNMENPFPSEQTRETEFTEQCKGTAEEYCSESAPPPLDVGPAHSPHRTDEPEVTTRSLDEGEIISEESIHGTSQKPSTQAKTSANYVEPRGTSAQGHSPAPRNESRRSSLDSGKGKEKKTAEKLKDFNRNPPTSEHHRKSSTGRSEIRDAVIVEATNVPRVASPHSASSRPSKDRSRGLSSLFDEGNSNPSSRESSPRREKSNKREEERRRREKEMERERQRDKERLKRQRRDREREKESERGHRTSPDRKMSDRKSQRTNDDDRARESKEKEKRREPASDERKVIDEEEKRKAAEKARRDLIKKKREEELEAKRQAELQRRAEAMKRKEEEERRKRQEEKERQEERRREEEKRQLEEEKQRKRDEERLRLEKEKEKTQRRRDEDQRRPDDQRKDEELERRTSDESEDQEIPRSREHSDDEGSCSEGENAPGGDQVTRIPDQVTRNDDEVTPARKESANLERSTKPDPKKPSETETKTLGERDTPLPMESDDDVVSATEGEEKKRKPLKEESRPPRGSTESRKPPPLPSRRREDSKKTAAKPLEPGMMMSDTGVLDRINKEMESLAPRSRNISGRSPDESSTTTKSTSMPRIPKRDAPVDYNQVLFSNPAVVKRTPPSVEKKKNYVISSGLQTDNVNQLVYSRAHSSRLGMFLEKVSDKHKKLMERDNDRAMASPAYEDFDRNETRSPVGFSHSRHQPPKFAPQKRPLPASTLDSYLGSPTPESPDIRDGDAATSRSSGKKCKLDLSKMPDIMEKLYGSK